jgi:hypothetical protein
MTRAASSYPLCRHSRHAPPGGDKSKSLRTTGRLSLRFMTLERPDRAGSLATNGNPAALDDLRFAQLANYGAIPDNYPRPHPETPLAWPKRMGWAALAVAVMVLAHAMIAVA